VKRVGRILTDAGAGKEARRGENGMSEKNSSVTPSPLKPHRYAKIEYITVVLH